MLRVLTSVAAVTYKAVAEGSWPGCDIAVRKEGSWPHRTEEQLSVDCSGLALGPQGGQGLGQRVLSLEGHASLTFDASHNDFGPDGTRDLLDSLGALQNLSSLTFRFDGNGLGDAGARILGAGLGRLAGLETLSLSAAFDDIEAAGVGDLAASLSRIFGLTSLSLHLKFNHVGSAGAAALGASLRRLSRLGSLHLDLYGNGIDDAGAADLATAIGQLKALSTLSLDLRYNEISAAGARDVWAGLGHLAASPSADVRGVPLPGASPARADPRKQATAPAGAPDTVWPSSPAVPSGPELVSHSTPAPSEPVASTTSGAVSVFVPGDIGDSTVGGNITTVVSDGAAIPPATLPATPPATPPDATAGSFPFGEIAGWFVALAFTAGFGALFWQKWGYSLREYGLSLLEMGQDDGGLEGPSATSAHEHDTLNSHGEAPRRPLRQSSARGYSAGGNSFESLYNQSLSGLQVADRAE